MNIDTSRRLGLACFIGLVLLCVAWEWRLAPLREGGSLLVLKALPALAVLPGMLRDRVRSWQVASLVVLIYATEGLVRATSDALPLSRGLGWMEAALATAGFAAVLLHVRDRRRRGY